MAKIIETIPAHDENTGIEFLCEILKVKRADVVIVARSARNTLVKVFGSHYRINQESVYFVSANYLFDHTRHLWDL